MLRCRYKIQLEIQAPFLSQSSGPGAFGLDMLLVRDSAGQIMLPGTLVAGRLRQAWEELNDAVAAEKLTTDMVPTEEEADALLGAAPEEGSVEPRRKQLGFGDFLCTTEEKKGGIRTRTAMDRERGAVAKGALLMMEYPFLSGDTLHFTGSLRYDAPSRERAERLQRQLLCGLQWIPHFGAFSSTGFGQLRNVSVTLAECCPIGEEKPAVTGGRFGLILSPEAPFCVAMRPVAGNIFTSRRELPGAVLKGALAQILHRCLQSSSGEERAKLQRLLENYHKIRFTHAFPADNADKRPVTPPLSLVKAGGKLYDLREYGEAMLVDGHCPEFRVDWKETADVDTACGWPQITKELRVRTALDRENNRHEEGSLFADELIVPKNLLWLAHVDGSALDETLREELLSLLAALLASGLPGIGKTKSFAACRIVPAEEITAVIQQKEVAEQKSNLLLVTLQTPALLHCPPLVSGEKEGASALKESCSRSWDELGEGVVKLKHLFARQTLSGGSYQNSHFRWSSRNAARPWLLTEAGSLFVLEYKEADRDRVQRLAERWQRHGLPLPETVKKYWNMEDGVPLWQQCPFLPENGYGEVCINLNLAAFTSVPTEINPINREVCRG